MKSNEYWDNRAARRMYEYVRTADEVSNEITKAYMRSTEYLKAEIRKIYVKFRGNLSDKEARELLSNIVEDLTYDKLRAALRQVKDPNVRQQLLNQLNAPAYRARIDRLIALQKDIDRQCKQLYEIENRLSTEAYKKLVYDSYYQSIFDIQQQMGVGFGFARMDRKKVDEILKNEWSGEHYSKRIWNNTDKLAKSIKEELLVNAMTGKSYRDMAIDIQAKMASGSMEARRLVRTETNNVANSAKEQSYLELGIEKYRFVAVLDRDTSKICRSLDGNVYPVKEIKKGTNYPPMHPWCRSIVRAELDPETMSRMKRRARDPKTGETYLVPANMTYAEWEKKYVPYAEAERQKIKNESSDRIQYNKYKVIFGEKIPKTFDDFQELKYNNIELWNEFKRQKQEHLNQKSFEELQELKYSLGDREVRIWYKSHDENIPNIIDTTQDLETQARQAHKLRNDYRTQARDLMADQEKRKVIDTDKPNLTFEQMMEHKKDNYGLVSDDAYRDIIRSSTTTNKKYDEAAGVKGDDK